jgi:hypothetical protein
MWHTHTVTVSLAPAIKTVAQQRQSRKSLLCMQRAQKGGKKITWPNKKLVAVRSTTPPTKPAEGGGEGGKKRWFSNTRRKEDAKKKKGEDS